MAAEQKKRAGIKMRYWKCNCMCMTIVKALAIDGEKKGNENRMPRTDNHIDEHEFI